MVPLKRRAVHPGDPDLLASRAAVPAGRNEENWFPRKTVQCTPGDPDLLASSAAVPAGRNEENCFPRKTVQCIPASPISWLPWRRSRREGMRKSGSVEKKYGDSPAALTCWFPGRGSKPGGMSKSGSCKENVPGSFFVAELEGSRRARHRGGFRERPKS